MTPRMAPKCVRCGSVVAELPQEVADNIASAECRPLGMKAFQCTRFNTILFEDELLEGQFNP